ncbi:MAG: aldo/keto reductase [Nitriliruptoraceae bacterium]|nr:aldo/keto reductase [Nitriliruptoraceae bacterium]
MHRATLGDSDLEVSTYALGAMTFGEETAEPEARTILDAYREAGGNHLDLADVYTHGLSERIVGRWLADRGCRDELVLASKVRFPVDDPDGPDGEGLDPTRMERALEASLRRLGVDHLDLYLAHAGDPRTPMADWLAAMDGFVRAGKVRAVGVSNLRGYQLQRLVDLAVAAGSTPIAALQPQYNLLAREVEWEVLPCAREAGIAITPWSPLGGGWLTGKYRRDRRPSGATRLGEDPDRGVEAYDTRGGEARTWDVLEVVEDVARTHAASMGQVALAWCAAQPGVVSTILGVRTLAQLEDNLGALELHLGDAELQRLDEVSAPPTPHYPYRLFDEMDAARLSS